MNKKFTGILWAIVVAAATAPAFADDHHHHQFARDVEAFHAVLAPIWHARPGPERLPAACAKVDELAQQASAIRSTGASSLVASIAAMKTACQGRPVEVDGAFHDVHEAFHHLIDVKTGSDRR